MDCVLISKNFHPVTGKQGQLQSLLILLTENLNALTPSLLLAVVNLTQIQKMLLHGLSPSDPPVFHYAPVAVLFAVFPAFFTT